MFNLIHSIINYFTSPLFMVKGARTLVPLVALGTGCYLLIVHPQREQQRRHLMVTQHLKPGATVKTANNHQGTVIFITHNTVIIELTTGQKIEVLKQTITDIAHEKI